MEGPEPMNLDALIQLDQRLTLWLNQLGTPAWDPFWLLLSDIKIWFPAYAVVMACLIWKLGWKKGLAVILSLVATVVFIDQTANAVKDGFERLRPCFNAWMIANGVRTPYGLIGPLYGFFSAHAANSFGFAIASYLGFKLNDPEHSYKVYGWGVFIWAAFLSFSRIMMAAHFLGDVLVGTCYGLAVGLTIAGITWWITVKVIR